MKKFKMPSLLKAYKKLDISKAKMKTKSYIVKAKKSILSAKMSTINGLKKFSPKKYSRMALLVVLFVTTVVLGSTAYYTGIIDIFKRDSIPYVEVNIEEPEVKTVPSVIPENPDVIGTPSLPVEEEKLPEEIDLVEEAPEISDEIIEMEFIMPANGEVIRDFGFNYSKTYKDYRFHDGIDIKVPQGAIIQAAADGKVVKAGYTEIERYTVTIDHGSYLQTYYKHLCEVNVTKGDTLKQGQEIGKIINPESYLHFGITHKGDNQDPTRYIEELKTQNE